MSGREAEEDGEGTDLVRCECLWCDERSRSEDDDLEGKTDHRGEVLLHEFDLGIDEAEEEGESTPHATERLSDSLADPRLLDELTFDEKTIGLGEGGDDGLLAREGFAKLCLPDLDLAFLGVLLRLSDLGLLSGKD